MSQFQKAVYKAVNRIPFGQTRSYQWVARKTGRPKAVRAIGEALKKNPFPFAIPCHRVIRKDKTLGGYILGKELKKKLLNWEKNILS
ncbi:MAG: MGMT family protein [Candidatus Omnitrophica bacterium]|nr:MGMT family protein [Candidatus Omnitrophota bacterium]